MYSNKTTYINLVAMCFHSEETSFLRHIGVWLTEQEEYLAIHCPGQEHDSYGG